MKIAHSAGGVVLNRKGQILIVNQRGRSWSLPKGHIEKGETVLGAARREIYEETGLRRLRFVKLLGSYHRTRLGSARGETGGPLADSGTGLKKLTFFLFETDAERVKPVDPDNPEARWVAPDQAVLLLTHPKDQEFLNEVLRTLQPSRHGPS